MEFLNRKSPRLKNYNYSSEGTYFITICTKNSKPVLSSIRDIGTVGRDDLGAPNSDTYIQLSKIGEIVDKYINFIPQKYKNVSVDSYIIMPDHIHMLLSINNKEWRAESSRPTSISQVIGIMKRLINKEVGNNIFQASFNDHIIRNEEDFVNHLYYIENNPVKWFYNKSCEE